MWTSNHARTDLVSNSVQKRARIAHACPASVAARAYFRTFSLLPLALADVCPAPSPVFA
jgi:hypothetical protein